MAIMPALMPGVQTSIAQNVVYALPGKIVRVQSTAAVEVSVDNSTWSVLTGANTVGADTSATFLRCPGGAAVVVVKGM